MPATCSMPWPVALTFSAVVDSCELPFRQPPNVEIPFGWLDEMDCRFLHCRLLLIPFRPFQHTKVMHLGPVELLHNVPSIDVPWLV